MKSKEEIEKMISIFETLRDEIDGSIKRVGRTAKNFIKVNTILRDKYQSFIDGLKYCIEP